MTLVEDQMKTEWLCGSWRVLLCTDAIRIKVLFSRFSVENSAKT